MFLYKSEEYKKARLDAEPSDGVKLDIPYSHKQSNDSIKKVIDNQFKSFNWENTIVAGGAIVSELTGTKINDIDIYIYGLKTSKEYEDKIRSIVASCNYNSIRRSKYCITLNPKQLTMQEYRDITGEFVYGNLKTIQIILTNDKTPEDIIDSFDIGASMCYYQDGEIYMHEKAIRDLKFNTIEVDLSKRTSVLEYRFKKYAKQKGFSVVVPDLDMNKVDKKLLLEKTGLGYLLDNVEEFDFKSYYEENPGKEKPDGNIYKLAQVYDFSKNKWFILSDNIDDIINGKMDRKVFKELSLELDENLIPKFDSLGFNTTCLDLRKNSEKYITKIQKENWLCYKPEFVNIEQQLRDEIKEMKKTIEGMKEKNDIIMKIMSNLQ